MRPLLIGQAPGPNSDPRYPLLGGHSGERLRAVAGLSLREYVAAFDRVNLLASFPGRAAHGDVFPLGRARLAAAEMMASLVRRGGRVIFVGSNVAKAFDFREQELTWCGWIGGLVAAKVPHPSAVNLWWNDPENVRKAGRFLRGAAGKEELWSMEPRPKQESATRSSRAESGRSTPR